ncbi:MAG: hypothetical protein Q8Q60_01660 [Candidatus Chromulinivorax sp.]|nr:hypothetical protein [Candidatus Chromulinivorax sp.]
MKKYIILIFCFLFHDNYAEQFVYPVADFDNGNQLMILYQKSLNCVELWFWNTTNHRAMKGLSSFFTPANLRMMPSGKGFSFIDQGYIKIKEFVKRSPRTLPIYEPIGLFSSMNWIDDETFYFVAREGDFFQIFQGDLQANIQRLTNEPADALYPQKIGSTLFYMQRNMSNQITIISQPWNPIAINRCETLHDTSCQSVIMQSSLQQLCFLRMISEREGFYLQAPIKKKNKNNDCFEFICHHLMQQNDNQWITEKLFTFQIPSKYLIGSTRLYESLEPFLPNYNNENMVYFVNWEQEADQFQLCTYNIATKNIESACNELLRYRKNGQQIFAPYIHKDFMHCGFILHNQRNSESLQHIFEMDDVEFSLPYCKIK